MGQFLLLGAGVVLGIIGSIIANLLTPRVFNFLDSRRVLRQSKRFKTAAKFHKLITELHSGRRDRHAYFNRLLAPIIVGPTVAFAATVGGVVISYIQTAFHLHTDQSIIYLLSLFFLSALMMGIYVYATIFFKHITDALDNFDKFDAEFKNKWPEKTTDQETAPT